MFFLLKKFEKKKERKKNKKDKYFYLEPFQHPYFPLGPCLRLNGPCKGKMNSSRTTEEIS